MTEQDKGSQGSDWVVGPDGFTFHEHVDRAEQLAELSKQGQIADQFLRSLTHGDPFKRLGESAEIDLLRPEGHELDF